MMQPTPKTTCDQQLADTLDALAHNLDRIASAVVNLGADGRARLLGELRAINGRLQKIAASVEERSDEPAATP